MKVRLGRENGRTIEVKVGTRFYCSADFHFTVDTVLKTRVRGHWSYIAPSAIAMFGEVVTKKQAPGSIAVTPEYIAENWQGFTE